MMQKLYRVLEINFQEEKERRLMQEFARTGVYDFVEEEQSDSNLKDHLLSSRDKVDGFENEDASNEDFNSQTR